MPSGAPAHHGLDDLRNQREEPYPLRDAALTPVLLDSPCSSVQDILSHLSTHGPTATRLAPAQLASPDGLNRSRSVVQSLPAHMDSLLRALELLAAILFPLRLHPTDRIARPLLPLLPPLREVPTHARVGYCTDMATNLHTGLNRLRRPTSAPPSRPRPGLRPPAAVPWLRSERP